MLSFGTLAKTVEASKKASGGLLEAISDVLKVKYENQFTNAFSVNKTGGTNKCQTQDQQKSGSVPTVLFPT